MSANAAQDYRVTQVLTSPPQKLHLMLVEGALRLAQSAKELWKAGKFEEGAEPDSRCRDIVSEMLAALDHGPNPELSGRVASLYVYMFRTLSEAHLAHDGNKLNHVIRVLEIERDAWRELCRSLGNAPPPVAARFEPDEALSTSSERFSLQA